MANRKNNRKIGSDYEKIAAAYLKQQGFFLLEQNFYSRCGEIDIIAKDGRYLVFVEVKYRSSTSCGDPLEAVNAKKQKHICRTAFYYCVSRGYPDTTPCRFDVIAISGDGGVVHVKNAFMFQV